MLPRRLAAVATVAILGSVALVGCSNSSDDHSSMPDMPGMSGMASASGSASAGASIAFADATQGSLHLTQGYVFATSGMDMSSGKPMTSDSAMPSASASSSAMDMMSAAYATLQNTGSSDDALVSVSTDAAKMAQLHETVSSGGNAGSMHQVDTIDVPAGGKAELKPGGNHVMLMQLTGPLKAGTTITMTWTFKSGTVITTTFPVIDRSQRPN